MQNAMPFRDGENERDQARFFFFVRNGARKRGDAAAAGNRQTFPRKRFKPVARVFRDGPRRLAERRRIIAESTAATGRPDLDTSLERKDVCPTQNRRTER
ncbi:hypothetical protein C0Z17_08165 [Trinickia caryophylli]|nr:hypothetical protein C0Z17_08165 [Trinickia caryophylli]